MIVQIAIKMILQMIITTMKIIIQMILENQILSHREMHYLILVYCCIGILVYWYQYWYWYIGIGILVYWYIGISIGIFVLVYWYWYIGILVFVLVLAYWYICIGILVYWYIGIMIYCISIGIGILVEFGSAKSYRSPIVQKRPKTAQKRVIGILRQQILQPIV